MKEAMLYEKLEKDAVRCQLCAHRCRIKTGTAGICKVRVNREGTLYTLVYGRTISLAVDPIEKKPLYHFHPGSGALSMATRGCNFKCDNCQNFSISQLERVPVDPSGHEAAPERIAAIAVQEGCATIAYTYTEPTIFGEYALATARQAHRVGVKNVFVTNGFWTSETLDLLEGHLDAANVDLKSFSDAFYRQNCQGRLKPVLEGIEKAHGLGIWLEITTLLIPGLNDSEAELRDVARFLAGLSPAIPWHISRFHPTYQMTDRPATSVKALIRAREIGMEAGLHYVYIGNAWGVEGAYTYCPGCARAVIKRHGFAVTANHVSQGACGLCGAAIQGVGLTPGGGFSS